MGIGKVIWITGLPCAGKTTIANYCVEQLKQKGIAVEHLDGDVVRSQIDFQNYSAESRELHLRYIALMASKLANHGVNVFCSFVSPRESQRDFARSLCSEFYEAYVDTSVEECAKRDVKGLYAKASRGEIENFTGVDGIYERPQKPEFHLITTGMDFCQSAQPLLKLFF